MILWASRVRLTTAVDKELVHLRSLLATAFGLVQNIRKFQVEAPADDVVILGVRFVFSKGSASVSPTRVGPGDAGPRGLRKLCGVLSFSHSFRR